MSATKYDVSVLNVNSSTMFEESKATAVRSKDDKKVCDRKVKEVEDLIADAKKAVGLSIAEQRETDRAIAKLEISKNYLLKAVGSFNDVEETRKLAADALEVKRKEKDALIAKRSEERKVRDDNRKKKELEDLRAKAKEKAELGL